MELENLIKKATEGDAKAQYELGDYYYKNKDYDNAVKYLKLGSDNGNIDAEVGMAVCYFYGRGVEKDIAKAHSIFEKCANLGNARAQFNLGLDYYDGENIEKDYKKAFELFSKSAEQGLIKAQAKLGDCYYNGNGVEKNIEKAIEWFEKAAEQGNLYACDNLGEIYYSKSLKYDEDKHEVVVTQNVENALKWFSYRKNPNDENAKKILNCYDILARDEHRDIDINELYKSAVIFESSKILLEIGGFFEFGKSILKKEVKKDLKKAFEFYLKAAQNNDCLDAYYVVIYFAFTYSDVVENNDNIIKEYTKKIQERRKFIITDTLDDLF